MQHAWRETRMLHCTISSMSALCFVLRGVSAKFGFTGSPVLAALLLPLLASLVSLSLLAARRLCLLRVTLQSLSWSCCTAGNGRGGLLHRLHSNPPRAQTSDVSVAQSLRSTSGSACTPTSLVACLAWRCTALEAADSERLRLTSGVDAWLWESWPVWWQRTAWDDSVRSPVASLTLASPSSTFNCDSWNAVCTRSFSSSMTFRNACRSWYSEDRLPIAATKTKADSRTKLYGPLPLSGFPDTQHIV
mmetsp:Transcript_111240/g.314874  ORF Transcript_111240/g.314874 Transcript_111240/m.314874 type:complete len:247 (+) Transcript_111240:234-974(+)